MPKSDRPLSDVVARSLTSLIQSRVRRFVASTPSLAGQCEDLVQEVYLRLLERFDRFDPARGSLNTFVCQITESVLLDHSRRLVALKRNPTENLHGESVMRLDARHTFDATTRQCVIDTDTAVGRDLAKLFVGFLQREFGPDSFTVERVAKTPAMAGA